MILALFILPVTLIAISVGAAMFTSPFMASYVICFLFQAIWQGTPQSPRLPYELRMVALFLLPVLSFAMTVMAIVVSAQQRRKKLGKNQSVADRYVADPSDMFDPVAKRRAVGKPSRSASPPMLRVKKIPLGSIFTSDEAEFSSRRRMKF